MVIDDFASNAAIARELGQRLKDARIDASLTQAQLAAKAGVSQKTITNLEGGSDVTLGSLVSVLRALALLSRMDLLVPQQEVRPSELLTGNQKRQRVRASKDDRMNASWKWGDES